MFQLKKAWVQKGTIAALGSDIVQQEASVQCKDSKGKYLNTEMKRAWRMLATRLDQLLHFSNANALDLGDGWSRTLTYYIIISSDQVFFFPILFFTIVFLTLLAGLAEQSIAICQMQASTVKQDP